MKNLKRLLSYMRGQEMMYVLALMFTLFSQVIVALQPKLIKITIDSVIGKAALANTFLENIVSIFKNYLNVFCFHSRLFILFVV